MSPNQSTETVHIVAQLECPYCRNIYDRNKLVFNSIISQYICLDCRQMLMDRSEQRRIFRERNEQETHRQDTHRRERQTQETHRQEREEQETDENV